jgi:hypothetical protein
MKDQFIDLKNVASGVSNETLESAADEAAAGAATVAWTPARPDGATAFVHSQGDRP